MKTMKRFGVAAVAVMIVGMCVYLMKMQITSNNPPHHTSQELHDFWDAELNEWINSYVGGSNLVYPEINKRFEFINQSVVTIQKKPVAISLVEGYHLLNPKVLASAGLNASARVANIELYIPALLNQFNDFKKTGRPNWHNEYRTHVLIVMMHELEHLAQVWHVSVQPTHIDIAEESRAWAETCRHTMVPLVENYKVTICDTEATFYKAWKVSGGNTNHVAWTDALNKIYGGVAR
jgi:hypothetical protein